MVRTAGSKEDGWQQDEAWNLLLAEESEMNALAQSYGDPVSGRDANIQPLQLKGGRSPTELSYARVSLYKYTLKA